jgi:hypothetical protein
MLTSIQQLGLKDIQVQPTLSLMRLLLQVRSSKDLTGSIDDFIGETASVNPADFRPIGFSGEIYSTSCQAIMSDDLNAAGGASFGPATVSGSLDASVKLDSKSGLYLTKGRLTVRFTHERIPEPVPFTPIFLCFHGEARIMIPMVIAIISPMRRASRRLS